LRGITLNLPSDLLGLDEDQPIYPSVKNAMKIFIKRDVIEWQLDEVLDIKGWGKR